MTKDIQTVAGRGASWKAALICLPFALALMGCGATTLAPVTGKVSYKGGPVTGGMLFFAPLGSAENETPGKSAFAEVQSDGSYVLQTEGIGNGALIGRHHVAYTPPTQELTEEQRTNPRYTPPPPPYMGLVPKPSEVEVKPGPNTIDIELVKER